MSTYVGIEIGGTKLQLVLGDEKAQILERRKLTVAPGADASTIRRQIELAIPELIRGKEITCVGVGFGGPVDWRTGRICRSHQIEGWSEFNLAGWLNQLVHAEVVADNDANVAALGEARHGAGVGFDPVFYVTLGSGVGGGLVLDEQIYHGATPGEAEIGHIRLDKSGVTLEERGSGWAVDRRIRELKTNAPSSLLCRLMQEATGANLATGGEAKFLAAGLEQEDSAAKQILSETAQDLALGLSHAVHLFHPQLIILGGGLSGIGEPLRKAVQVALHGLVMEVFRPGLRVALAALGADAVPVGALELARKPK